MKRVLSLAITVVALHCSMAQSLLTPVDNGSKVHFVIENFGIKTGGSFSGLNGAIKFDPINLAASYFEVSVIAKTINTGNGTRDGHLRKPEYLDVEKYKTISIKSSNVTKSTKVGWYNVSGAITIKGVTKPLEFGFSATPKNGGYLFEGEFEINRRDFGVGGSSISMSDKLKVSLSVFAKSIKG